MPYCKGGDLLSHITKNKNLTERLASKYISTILKALSYCHANQIAHLNNLHNKRPLIVL